MIKGWTYPATPGPGVIPRAAASDAAGNLCVVVETLTGTQDWVVLKFDRAGKRLWKRSYDSGNGADTPYSMVVDHHGAVIVSRHQRGRRRLRRRGREVEQFRPAQVEAYDLLDGP